MNDLGEKNKIIGYSRQYVKYDRNTGEVDEYESEHTMVRPKEPPYIKIYLQYVMFLADLPKGLTPTMHELLKRMTFADDEEGGQIIYVNAHMKEKIAKRLGITTKVLTNNISKLHKQGVLIRLGGGTYQANPYLFGRGDWKDIRKLRTSLTFDQTRLIAQTDFIYDESSELKEQPPLLQDINSEQLALDI